MSDWPTRRLQRIDPMPSPGPVPLSECPFCGTQPRSHFVGDDDGGYHAIECRQCTGAHEGPFCGVHADSEQAAIEAWNRRAKPPSTGDGERAKEWLKSLSPFAGLSDTLIDSLAREFQAVREDCARLCDEAAGRGETPVIAATLRLAASAIRQRGTTP